MKILLFNTALLIAFIANAQKGLEEMIAAEKAFAAYSVANNTKDAFLKFMDTSAVMFKDGEPYKAYDDWMKKEKRPGVLNWWPRYAEISASGDFGWTAGPWTFQPQSVNDSVIANGYFFTMWKKNSAGEWKFILDVGTDSGKEISSDDVTRLTAKKISGSLTSLHEAEKAIHTEAGKMQAGFFGENAITAFSVKPFLDEGSVQDAAGLNSILSFTLKGSGIASSGDIGYTYGSYTYASDKKNESYLRIWRHEPSGWKIALQLLRW